jgi:hypothetical protein
LNAEMKCPLHFEIYEEDTGRSWSYIQNIAISTASVIF